MRGTTNICVILNSNAHTCTLLMVPGTRTCNQMFPKPYPKLNIQMIISITNNKTRKVTYKLFQVPNNL